MCENCFTEEIKSFPDQKSWITFDFILTKKVEQGKMRWLKFVRTAQRNRDDGQYLYECATCQELWKLKDPDNAFRGYFIKASTLPTKPTGITIGYVLLAILALILLGIIYSVLITS